MIAESRRSPRMNVRDLMPWPAAPEAPEPWLVTTRPSLERQLAPRLDVLGRRADQDIEIARPARPVAQLTVTAKSVVSRPTPPFQISNPAKTLVKPHVFWI